MRACSTLSSYGSALIASKQGCSSFLHLAVGNTERMLSTACCYGRGQAGSCLVSGVLYVGLLNVDRRSPELLAQHQPPCKCLVVAMFWTLMMKQTLGMYPTQRGTSCQVTAPEYP